ncbi:epimerase [Burkholderia humptydooensis]|uniref:Epimerase n=2 Tax=Burkholderia humptydooensis TaxID=430531 RepID=A0A7U4PBL8_9BURK|nr:NAD-dependent epimerase/dehydratase family domain protein [Burkholderia sp. 2002721687]ALX46573.1 epimerase [Burkholderia humptydooensis]EIP86011.1 NAD-dependent epimerase/dehydratase family protein [Burkholderia humptydooensis MSMB43]QPS45883.1 epimerase [Burkholderia humptydooensis]
MREMRYLWREALRMDNAKLVTALGREPHTPLDAAVETLVGRSRCARRVSIVASPSSANATCALDSR